jgi:hypothetical protein
MEKITRQYIDTLISTVSIANYMEDEYNSDFVDSKMSNWANTCCPMPNHDDSNPSFGVNTESNRYNCFGCGATGDIIKLVQSVEGLNFIEAIQKISSYSGIEVETTNLDFKYLVNEFKSTINDYLNKENENKFPGGLSETNFLIAFSDRSKKFLRLVNINDEDFNWVESVYKEIELLTEKQDYKNLTKVWKDFGKQSKEKMLKYNESQS